jgi:cell division protein FtsB
LNLNRRAVQAITVAAVAFILIMAVALIINLVRLAALNSRRQELQELYDRGVEMSARYEDEIAMLDSAAYIEQYAREYLDYMGAGEIPFKKG